MRRRTSGITIGLISGMAIGAFVMYALDPDMGRRRRALARDKLLRGGKALAGGAGKQARNLWNHLRGGIAEQSAAVRDRSRVIDDDVLHDRVKAQLGHAVNHPGALQIRVRNGQVAISGPVLGGEQDKIRQRLEQTRGIRGFEIRVEEHASAEGIPALQGQSRSARPRKKRIG